MARETSVMSSSEQVPEHPQKENLVSAENVQRILLEHGWLAGEPSLEQLVFCERAAALLGPHATNENELRELLGLVFHYDAGEILNGVEAHTVLARYNAREVVRHLALFLLDPAPFTSERFKEMVNLFKEKCDLRGRDLFHPLRLVLAGRSGGGELDRVILLVDEAAPLGFPMRVKTVRERILEFCSLLD
jgi:nondiscriminating glutamyl-tRNA synthetase